MKSLSMTMMVALAALFVGGCGGQKAQERRGRHLGDGLGDDQPLRGGVPLTRCRLSNQGSTGRGCLE